MTSPIEKRYITWKQVTRKKRFTKLTIDELGNIQICVIQIVLDVSEEIGGIEYKYRI